MMGVCGLEPSLGNNAQALTTQHDLQDCALDDSFYGQGLHRVYGFSV